MREKGSAVLVPKRLTRFCQDPDCVYNRNRPGEPARVDGKSLCIWCDSDGMETALATNASIRNIRITLSCFEKCDLDVYAAAVAKLPEDFKRRNAMYCDNRLCIFNKSVAGKPARLPFGSAEKYCVWCDAER